MSDSPSNPFLHGRLSGIYVRTAIPIILVMAMHGSTTVIDALFLGQFVGPEALAAVTLMFPLFMLIISLSTLVSSGTSSLLARHLGGERIDDARAVFAGAHGLALFCSAIMIMLFLVFGNSITRLIADGSRELADMGHTYIQILILCSPILFVLSINSDTLRNEGRVGLMAVLSLLVSVANIALNYLLIVVMQLGVAGSAYGTVLANVLALSILVTFRLMGRTQIRPSALLRNRLHAGWGRILALGAPQSLNFFGVSLTSMAIIAALQVVQTDTYEITVSAFGIINRVFTFGFLPLLGLSHAMQTITGNNFGASAWARSNRSLQIAIGTAFVYCLSIQTLFIVFAPQIGGAFVEEVAVIDEVAQILPIAACAFFIAGPTMMVATYFQAIGDASRAAVLSLTRPYLFSIPLTFALPQAMGEIGIWVAGPASEILLLLLVIVVLWLTARRLGLHWGLFQPVL